MSLQGECLGPYRLLRLLGSGGMGEVYLAEDVRIGQQVAIKVIRNESTAYPENESAKEAARLFEREAKAIARLDHPHILPLYAYGEETLHGQMLTYLVMPYRKEGTLANWLRRRGNATLLAPAEAVPLVQQAAQALQHAHRQQVIHQDIKPTNFLVRLSDDQPDQPDLLLADFGIAKLSSATASASQSIRGTPTYMAPEQWEGHPVLATDQYALAIMVYELLVGRPPFQGGPGQVMRQHYFTPPPAPSSLNSCLSPAMGAVLLRALAKRPEDRFPSVAAFAQAFQEAAQDFAEPHVPLEATSPAARGSGVAPTLLAALSSTPPTEVTAPVSHTFLPAAMVRSSTPSVPQSEMIGVARAGKRSISLHVVLLGLAGLMIVTLASGIVWFTTHHAPLTRNNPASPTGDVHASPAGIVTEFLIPAPNSYSAGIAAGPDGNLWYTEEIGKVLGSHIQVISNQIGRITLGGVITRFSLPAATGNSGLQGITTGPDGNLWFTEGAQDMTENGVIGRITSGK